MPLKLTPTGGRYPGGPASYAAANIRARLELRGDLATIRIEDLTHSDRWETFTIPTRTLLAALFSHQPEEEDGPAGDERGDENN